MSDQHYLHIRTCQCLTGLVNISLSFNGQIFSLNNHFFYRGTKQGERRAADSSARTTNNNKENKRQKREEKTW
jgi:hypothetical protein